jgi:Tfp pilus assembly protein PilV
MNISQSKKFKKSQSGFALLLTLVVVSIILAVGLSLLNITMKQLSLSSIARESEIAFYAASTGIECMQYHRSLVDTREAFLGEGNLVDLRYLECADQEPILENTEISTIPIPESGTYLYNFKYRYNLAPNPLDAEDDTCVETSLYITDLRAGNTDLSEPIVNEGLEDISCIAGSVCTTIFARGYNRPCNQLTSLFTVSRELTIEY